MPDLDAGELDPDVASRTPLLRTGFHTVGLRATFGAPCAVFGLSDAGQDGTRFALRACQYLLSATTHIRFLDM